LILIDALSSACWVKKRNSYFLFPQGQTHLAGCAMGGISGLLDAIKG
jgi:hypothetical protein